MKKISKRDVFFFLLGFLTLFLIDIITDWQGTKDAAKKGWNSVEEIEKIE